MTVSPLTKQVLKREYDKQSQTTQSKPRRARSKTYNDLNKVFHPVNSNQESVEKNTQITNVFLKSKHPILSYEEFHALGNKK